MTSRIYWPFECNEDWLVMMASDGERMANAWQMSLKRSDRGGVAAVKSADYGVSL